MPRYQHNVSCPTKLILQLIDGTPFGHIEDKKILKKVVKATGCFPEEIQKLLDEMVADSRLYRMTEYPRNKPRVLYYPPATD